MDGFRIYSISATVGYAVLLVGAALAYLMGPGRLPTAVILLSGAITICPTVFAKIYRQLKKLLAKTKRR